MDPDDLTLPVIADTTVRKAFNGWIDDFARREKSDQDDKWPSNVRRDACIAIDKPALASLLNVPDFNPPKISTISIQMVIEQHHYQN